MRNKPGNNELLYKYLKILGTGYETGDFIELFPYLADDCVWESQWRLDPEKGKEKVINYYNKKGDILRETEAFPKWTIVEFVDDLNLIKGSTKEKEGKTVPVRFGLMYEAGKPALLMSQKLDDVTNATIVDIKIDDQNLIRRIDMCMPELFKFVKYDTDKNN